MTDRPTRAATRERTTELLRSLELAVTRLRARGIPLPRLEVAGSYARYLMGRALSLTPAPENEEGFDAVDSEGRRYRIVGRRPVARSVPVVVPGLPDRRFERLVVVAFGRGYGVVSARLAEAEAFLRRARYRETANEWSLELDDDFWNEEAEDLTGVVRRVAAEASRDLQPAESARALVRGGGDGAPADFRRPFR